MRMGYASSSSSKSKSKSQPSSAMESVNCLLRGLEDVHPAAQEVAKKSLERLVQFCCVYGYQKIGA